MQTNTICFINQKGGVRKKVRVVFHLAGYFSPIWACAFLVIDADPQGSLSQGFFGSATVENLPASDTLAVVFADDRSHVMRFCSLRQHDSIDYP